MFRVHELMSKDGVEYISLHGDARMVPATGCAPENRKDTPAVPKHLVDSVGI